MSQNDALFQELDGYLKSVVEQLAANQRRRLSRQIATGLRKRQQQRIAQQQNPDGSSYEGRKGKPDAHKVASGLCGKVRCENYATGTAAKAAAVSE